MKNRGVALIYILLTMPILLMLAAFAINLAISYTTIEQAKSFSRLLSLSALKQYYDVIRDTSDKTCSDRSTCISPPNEFKKDFVDKVKNRVTELAKKNKFTAFKDKDFGKFVFSWEERPADPGGVMTPGTFYYAKPPFDIVNNRQPDPCGLVNLDYPCFIAVSSSAIDSSYKALNSVNAFKVEANYVDNITMRLFGSLLGDPVKEIKTCAVANAIKRNVMFVVDISGSSASETHKRRSIQDQILEPEKGRGGYFAYAVNPTVYPGLLEQNDNVDPPAGMNNILNDCYNPGRTLYPYSQFCHWDFLRYYNPDNDPGNLTDNDRIGPAITRPVGETNTSKHYYSDYFIKRPQEATNRISVGLPMSEKEQQLHPTPAEYPPLSNNSFRIDKFTNPEPLTSIFSALTAGIEQLVKRRIPGDKAGYLFFEKNLINSRMVKLTNQTYYLADIASNATRNDTSLGAGAFYYLRDRLGIFPSGLETEDYTDVYVALNSAAQQLIDNKISLSGAPSSDSIVYIGDFLPNCVAYKYLYPGECVSDCVTTCQLSCAAGASGDACRTNCANVVCKNAVQCNARNCADDHAHYRAAISELWDLVVDKIVPNKISLNVILAGKHVGPHTIDIPGGVNGCMSDTEARNAIPAHDYVLGQNLNGASDSELYYLGKSPEKPYYQAGYDAYRIARATGGIFKPVLNTPEPCVQDPLPACRPGTRRETDRMCRSQTAQMEDYVTEIVGKGNPFKIVNTDCDFSKLEGAERR